ncbi:HNH endonuclease [Duganella phyllosphaerae]|uniref:HNH endonuclease n=1 Tax=Duganella phyllosphaerae TaxID=762836 RepID=A0A1E7WCT7_9BURK|nr:HNH endonuclease signature motif containing protein [Duganella phyllosphaerae]OEZ95499.1 hypothetical protein DUPY_42730 [Duganella phyllosphaerae]
MIKSPKKISSVSFALLGISEDDQAALSALADKHLDKAWIVTKDKSPLTHDQKKLVKKFTASLKDYLYTVAQRRYCCFCGDRITKHKMTHDLEHINPKDGKSVLVFELRNLALACKQCNGPKGTKKVTVFPLKDDLDHALPGSSNYRIVHPHYDLWSDHFVRDKFDRVLSTTPELGFSKGSQTIEICGIHARNAMELADHFDYFNGSLNDSADWKQFYVEHMGANSNKGDVYSRIMSQILALDPAADELRDVLELP